MKKLIFEIIFLLLLVNVVAQEDIDANADEIEVDDVDVGITPDSPFYGLENAFKKISLAFAFSKEAKARKELEIARERLKEVKLMVEQNKLDAAQKAKMRHEEISEKLKMRFENEVGSDEDEIELQAEFESELVEQDAEIEDIRIRIEIKGDLNEEQKAKMMELVESLRSKGNEVRLKIDSREDRLKIKLKEKGLTEEEIEDRIEDRKEIGLDNALRNRIDHVRREIQFSEKYLNERNRENLKKHLVLAREILDDAEKSVNEKNFENAKELILKALRLAVSVRGEIRGEDIEAIKDKSKEIRENKEERKELVEKFRGEIRERIKEKEDDENSKDDDGNKETDQEESERNSEEEPGDLDEGTN